MSDATNAETKIGTQIVLPFSKVVEISLKSLRVRFWRSIITTSGVILAIGFYMSVTSTRAMTTRLEAAGDPEIDVLLQQMGIERSEIAATERRLQAMRASGRSDDLTLERIRLLESRLAQLETLAEKERRQRKTRDVWLVAMALLVCVVGITNAMLMSVTERFREIGTMKCLGALDRFVIQIFMLESSLQGVLGGLAGALVGLLMAFLSMYFAVYRHLQGGLLRFFPFREVFLSALFAVVIGAALSVVAAAYPAYRAARMKPVDAMRVDQ